MAHQQNNAQLYLLIKLQHLEQRFVNQERKNQILYFSLSITQDQMYFSSCIKQNSPFLSDDIIIPIPSIDLPQFITLHRWQNHMIIFSHEIDISQLKTRTTTKKKHQTKNGQILSFMIIVLNSQEIKFGNKLIQSISQHYLIINQIFIEENKSQQRGNSGPNYYIIRTSGNQYVMPLNKCDICIKLPQTLQFEHFKNGVSVGKSKLFNSNELMQKQSTIQLDSQRFGRSNLKVSMKWGINFFQTKTQNSLLLEAHQILIYDVQVKFDSYNQYANAKVKFVYGNKGFQVGNQFNTAKPAKIKKIIYFIIKSEDEEINIVVQKNVKIVGQSKFFTDEIPSYVVQTPKRKLIDQNGKVIGSIKFKCEKAKNLSTPSTNKFWKQVSKKKTNNSILLSIQQISTEYQMDHPVNIVFKTQSEQRAITGIPNFNFFDNLTQISYAPLVLSVKPQQSIYVMLKNQQSNKQEQSQNDFIGIAVLNFLDFKLGANSVQIQFFKNQGKVAISNCLINKVVPYPFVKSSFQPQILSHSKSHKTISITIFLKKVILTPYFYTYQYDNKDQVYCIFEVNRLKKVLIMQNSVHNDLEFVSSSSSDSLTFYIQQSEHIRVKSTFLVSDSGYQQQIYGWTLIKIKSQQLQSSQNGIKYNKVQLKNDFGTDIGHLSLQIHQGPGPNGNNKVKQARLQQSIAGPFKSQIKKVKNEIDKVNQNIEIMELSMKKKGKSPPQYLRKSQDNKHEFYNKPNPARYIKVADYGNKKRQRNHSVAGTNNQSIKLPHIKDNGHKQKSNLQDLVNMMKIRKRGVGGKLEQNNSIQSFAPQHPSSQRAATKQFDHNQSLIDPPFYTQKGSRENPNVQRSMDIIFPSKMSNINKKERQENIRKQINQYEQKLKGLRSALDNMQPDHAQQPLIVQHSFKRSRPSLRRTQRNIAQHNNNFNEEFEDNEFARDQI